MQRKIKQTKIVNITQDLNMAGPDNSRRDTKVNLDIGFAADECIVRQLCYNTTGAETAGTPRVYQLWSDLGNGGVLCVFPSTLSNVVPHTCVTLTNSRKVQKGSLFRKYQQLRLQAQTLMALETVPRPQTLLASTF
jgi:hypothetical protein